MATAYTMHSDRIPNHVIAEKLGVSRSNIIDVVQEMSHVLNGGRVKRKKGTASLREAVHMIKRLPVEAFDEKGNHLLPEPANINEKILPITFPLNLSQLILCELYLEQNKNLEITDIVKTETGANLVLSERKVK